MSDVPSTLRTRVGVALVWGSAAALAISLPAAFGWGVRVDLGGLRLSVFNPVRPQVLGLTAGALGLWLLGPAARVHFARPLAVAAYVAERGAWLAAALAFSVALFAVGYGTHVAGGSDPSGYLHEARLFTERRLSVPLSPLARELGLANGLHTLAPLGFRPAAVGEAAVPTYPPGLPMMLALFAAVGGDRAQLLVVPLSAAGVVWLTFVLGRRLAGSETAALAAAGIAASPIVLFQSLQPMSDVPAAFWWTAALLLATTSSTRAAVAAGAAAGVAGLVRPNLFVLAPLLAASLLWWDGLSRRALKRAAVLLAMVALAGTALAVWQRALYGAATETGYGSLAALFALDHLLPNLVRYPRWLIETHSALLLLAGLGPLAIRRRLLAPLQDESRAARVAWSGLGLFVALLAFYAVYVVFDEWLYIRFLLPMLPMLVVLAGAALAAALRRVPPSLSGLALLVAIVVIVGGGLSRTVRLGAATLQLSEARYATVARFVATLPPDTVCVAVQHSGSLAYYTARPLLRWDWIAPTEIDRAVAALGAAGRTVYAVLDDWEELQFRARFAGTRTVASLGLPVLQTTTPNIRTAVYRLSQ